MSEKSAYDDRALARPVLRAVTAENAHEFTAPPKRRGRPRKITATGNVVEMRPARAKASKLRPAPDDPALIGELSQLAIIASVRDLRESENSGLPMRMRHGEHLAAAYRSRGFLPPEHLRDTAEAERATE